LDVNVKVDFVFLFVRVNLFRIIYVDRFVKRLILDLLALHISNFTASGWS
jgi:hypothetical protein